MIKIEAQSARLVYVTFSGVTVRNVAYRGQAWFELADGQMRPAQKSEEFDRTENRYFYRDGSLDSFGRDVSASARAALAQILLATVTEWHAEDEGKAAMLEAEKARLENAMEQAIEAQKAATKALDAARAAAHAAEMAFSDFCRVNP